MEDVLTDHQVSGNISTNVRLFLAKSGLTQSELARRTGEHPVTIGQICNGRSASNGKRRLVMPGAGTMHRIAAVLEVSLDQLVANPPVNAEELICKLEPSDGRKTRHRATA